MDTLQYVYSSSESEDDELQIASTAILPKENHSASSSSSKKLPSAGSGRLRSSSPEERRYSVDKKSRSPDNRKDRRSSDRRSPSSHSRSSGSRDKRRSRDKDRDRDWDKDRDRERDRRYRKRSRSRSRSRPRREDRSKERRYDWRSRGHVRRDSPKRKSNDRSRSRSPPPRKHFDPKNKLYILTKMGIDYKGTESVDAPNRGGANVNVNIPAESAGVPNYYNPLTINAGKYADQIAKRKLLWNNKKTEKVEAPSGSNIWQGAKFSQDSDGKVAAKFQRLMGMKDGAPSTPNVSAGKGQDIIKKQEELFSSMEMQYEVARATTHTQRGVGLGFGPRHIP